MCERGGEQVSGGSVGLPVQAQAEVGLEDLAGRDPPPALGDGVEVMVGVVCAEMQVGDVRRGRRGRRGSAQQIAEVAPALLEGLAALLGDQRLEPPLPVGGAAQDVVVVGEVEVREGDGPVGVERDALDAGGEAVAQPAEPAAADGAAPGAAPWVPSTCGTASSTANGSSSSVATRSGSAPMIALPPGAWGGWGAWGLGAGRGGWVQFPDSANGSGSRSARRRSTWAGESAHSSGTRASSAEGDDRGDAKVGLTCTLLILYELVQ